MKTSFLIYLVMWLYVCLLEYCLPVVDCGSAIIPLSFAAAISDLSKFRRLHQLTLFSL